MNNNKFLFKYLKRDLLVIMIILKDNPIQVLEAYKEMNNN